MCIDTNPSRRWNLYHLLAFGWQADDRFTVPVSSRPTPHTVALMHVTQPFC
jgi:hypothetical protein